MITVHQVLSGAGEHDAITTEAAAFRTCFRAWGWGGGDHAFRIAPGFASPITGVQRLRARPGDVLLLHHSAGWPRLEELIALPNPKLLRYHNVTPPHWLWDYAPLVAAQCAVGREQLRELVPRVEMAAAVSAFNAAELTRLGAVRTEVIPLLIERERLGAPGSEPVGAPRVLFVGRLSPHKRQDELIRAFALYRSHRAPGARLALVGDPVSESFRRRLQDLGDSLAPGAVTLESGLNAEALAERYRAAHAFLCMSEHEGFCIPLLEAFHFGVPVLARGAGAVPEVLGDAGVLVDDQDLAVVAELLHMVVGDRQLAAELRRRGRARLSEYEPAEIARRLREAVEHTRAAAVMV